MHHTPGLSISSITCTARPAGLGAAGEALVGAARALYADEISTGLDSNTTHNITKALRNYCHVAQVCDWLVGVGGGAGGEQRRV
jgi:hypothetical protein